MLGGLSDSQITKEEVKVTVKWMKSRKATGLDGYACKMFENWLTSVFEWLVKLLNVCF